MTHRPTSPTAQNEQHAPIAVSVDNAVPISGVGRTLLYAAIKEKRLRSLKVGRRRLILLDDLAEYLRRHAQ